MDSSNIFKIEKLTGEKYYSWKRKVRLVLSYRELDDFIGIESKKPTDPVEAESWLRKDRKEMAITGISLSETHLNHVEGAINANQMWRSLMDIFERHNLLNKLTARRRFYIATMSETETVLAFTNQISQLGARLIAMGLIVEDQEMDMAALNGLPDKFDHLISALDTLGTED